MTSSLTERSYAEFFGENLLQEVLDLMPELNQDREHPLEKHRTLHHFLHHLSSPTLHPKGKQIWESYDRGRLYEEGRWQQRDPNKPEKYSAEDHAKLVAKGVENAPKGNMWQHLKKGFHAAFPEGEDEKTSRKKAGESQKHFRQFMHERGGSVPHNTSNLTGQNGKTKLSSGAGFHSTGLSLAPGHHSGYHDLCPKATGECRKNCLGLTTGGNRYRTSLKGKLLRTQYLHEHPEHAARLLSHEIGHHQKEAERKGMKHGFRMNMTSDVPYEHLMPKKFFEKHHKTQFYDYTKVPGRLHNQHLPNNYHLTLSHTGTGHPESNDKDVVHALHHGHVVAMVHQKGKIKPHHVEDVQSGKRWRMVTGDKDDNTFDRHKKHHISPGEGVVSGLKLKGVKNEHAGHFANKVDPDGVIRINHPKPANPFHVL